MSSLSQGALSLALTVARTTPQLTPVAVAPGRSPPPSRAQKGGKPCGSGRSRPRESRAAVGGAPSQQSPAPSAHSGHCVPAPQALISRPSLGSACCSPARSVHLLCQVLLEGATEETASSRAALAPLSVPTQPPWCLRIRTGKLAQRARSFESIPTHRSTLEKNSNQK